MHRYLLIFSKKGRGSTDVFQLGLVFYEMLTGVNPFAGEGMAEVVGKVMIHEPDPPSGVSHRSPRPLDVCR